MNDLSIGAVGAAIIAGLVSLLGLIIGKEQKVSEFRQAWIDELRKNLVLYLVSINAITDAVRVANVRRQPVSDISEDYKRLNEASNSIHLRINEKEKPSIDLKKSMEEFERIASSNASLTVENIKAAEGAFLLASKSLLKFEWKRVKRGEKTYFVTKYIVVALIVAMMLLFSILWRERATQRPAQASSVQPAASATNEIICQINASLARSDSAARVAGRDTRTRRSVAPLVEQAVCKGGQDETGSSVQSHNDRPSVISR
jgi:hypothetical protein